jgi:hypothetical protein
MQEEETRVDDPSAFFLTEISSKNSGPRRSMAETPAPQWSARPDQASVTQSKLSSTDQEQSYMEMTPLMAESSQSAEKGKHQSGGVSNVISEIESSENSPLIGKGTSQSTCSNH